MANSVFAYGSNTNRADFFERTGIDLSSYPSEIAILFGHKLGFTRFALSRNGGVLDIVPDNLAAVPGVLYHGIPDGVLDRMDRKEGVNKEDAHKGAYKRKIVSVWNTRSGYFEDSYTYQVVNPKPYIAPSDSYIDIVKAGMNEFRLPSGILDVLRGGASYPTQDVFQWALSGMGRILGESTRFCKWTSENLKIHTSEDSNLIPENIKLIRKSPDDVSKIVGFLHFVSRFVEYNKSITPNDCRYIVRQVEEWIYRLKNNNIEAINDTIVNNVINLIKTISHKNSR